MERIKTKSRKDLINQVVRIAEMDRRYNGVIWYAGESDKNTPRANKVWRIYKNYLCNMGRIFGRPDLVFSTPEWYWKMTRKEYAGY